MAAKLLPCPFCKSAAFMNSWARVVSDTFEVVGKWYQPQCSKETCKVMTPPAETEATATKQWNTRPK